MIEQAIHYLFMALGGFSLLGMLAFAWHCFELWSMWPVYLGRFAAIGWLATMCCLFFCAVMA